MKKLIADYELRTTKKISKNKYIVIFGAAKFIKPSAKDIKFGRNPESGYTAYGSIHTAEKAVQYIINPDFNI